MSDDLATGTSSKSTTVRLSVMMFLQFFVWGVFFVTMGTYLGKVFFGQEKINSIIGGIYATQTWGALCAPLIVGFLGDRIMNKERLNGVLQLAGAALLWWVSTITDSTVFFWAMLAFFICYMPTLALANTITFQNVENIERDFPKIRLWGTIGWIVGGLVISQSMFGLFKLPLLPGIEDGGRSNIQFKLAAIVSAVYGIYSFTLPASPPEGKEQMALGLFLPSCGIAFFWHQQRAYSTMKSFLTSDFLILRLHHEQ